MRFGSLVDSVREVLGDELFEEVRTDGRTLDFDAALDVARGVLR